MASLVRIAIRSKGSSAASSLGGRAAWSTSGSGHNTASVLWMGASSGSRFFNSATGIARNGGVSLLKRASSSSSSPFKDHVVMVLGASLSTVAVKVAQCDSPMIAGAQQNDSGIAEVYQRALQSTKTKKLALNRSERYWKRVAANIKRGLRMLLRALKLMVTLSPVVALYPVSQLLYHRDPNMEAQDIALSEDSGAPVEGPLGWYLRMCLKCVENSGAAVIKLMQWAGSRPDMFGHEFCSVFSKLQDDTTPHAWRHTERVLKEAYGENWKQDITIHKDKLLGSGCIGQVYKGQVKDNNGNERAVAVKVMHPNVEEDIDADLDLMRFFVRAIQKLPFMSGLKWLNLDGAVDEFSDMLKLQLDCRVEAANLEKFNENFKDSEHVVFPKLVDGYEPSKDVLIESFVEGVPVVQFAREQRDNPELLHKMCVIAIESVCKMIFLDNFMHGDLHPGNVFVDPKDHKFVLFDVGIVTAYTEEDHSLLVDILTAFIRRKGREAGRLMIDSSNKLLRDAKSEEHAVDEEQFIDKIEEMNRKATAKDHVMENLGIYITQICNAASRHHVMINQAFVSAALAVKVQEGIAIALDPSIEIWKVAIPIIWESERQRGKVKTTVMHLLGLDKLFNLHPPEKDPSSSQK